jgi:hypothetical protein
VIEDRGDDAGGDLVTANADLEKILRGQRAKRCTDTNEAALSRRSRGCLRVSSRTQ